MDDRWTAVVQMYQTSGHILKDGDLCGEGDVSCVLEKLVQTALQALHHQHREPGVGEETDAQELDDVRMAQVGEEPTFVVILVHQAMGALVLGVDEGVVEFLSCADQSVDFQLFYSLVGASAQLPTGRPRVGDNERAKLRSALQRPSDLLLRNYLPPCHFSAKLRGGAGKQ